DRLVARDDVRRGIVERFEEVLLAGLPRLPPAAAGADRSRALLVGEQVRGTGAEAVAGGAASDAVEDLLPGGDELLGGDVRAEGQRLGHLGLHLRDLVRDQGIEREHPEDDPDDLEVSDPHAGPCPPPPTRRSTSRRARRARTRTPRARGRSARTG